MVNVRQIAEMGAYVQLLEYDNIEGMILLSELSRRRIRSIQKLIRVGKNEVVVVLRVDKEKGEFDKQTRLFSLSFFILLFVVIMHRKEAWFFFFPQGAVATQPKTSAPAPAVDRKRYQRQASGQNRSYTQTLFRKRVNDDSDCTGTGTRIGTGWGH